jgi:hypothetical protein
LRRERRIGDPDPTSTAAVLLQSRLERRSRCAMAFPQLTGFDAPTVLENTVNTTPQIIDSDVTFTLYTGAGAGDVNGGWVL